ncbi:MFS transporter [Streptomyces jietaisiensis]
MPGALGSMYVVRAFDAVANAVVAYGVPLLVLLTTGSPALTGVAFAVEWAPRLVAFGVAGALADRFGPSRVLREANLVRAVFVSLAALVLWAVGEGTAALAAVMMLGAVSGFLAEISFVAVETLGSNAAHRSGDRGHQVQAALTGIDQGAALAGPLLGALALLVGPLLLLAGVAALALAAAVFTRAQTVPAPHVVGQANFVTGWRTLRGIPVLLWLVAGLAASNLATGVVQAGAPVMVIGHFRHSSTQVGLLWSGAAVASLIAVWCAQRAVSRWGIWPVGAVSAAVCTLASLSVAVASGFAAYAVTVAVLMAADGGQTVILRTLRARLIPPSGFASTLSVTIVLLLFPYPLAGLVVGGVPADHLGEVMAGCALLQGLVLACAFFRLRKALTAERLASAAAAVAAN